ncbi:MAG: helix-turn-helix transcriptional regulator [Bacteroidota bacterium]
MNPKDFLKAGSIIRARREEVGITKSEFARRLGCSPQNIDSLEQRKSIDFELAVKINAILDFDIFIFYQVGPSKEARELVELQRKYIELQEKYQELLNDNS